MKSLNLALVGLAAYTTQAAFNITSKPFRLVVRSSNATLDGTVLGACHQGAAIKGLCETNDHLTDQAKIYALFNHKVAAPAQPNAVNIHGVLTHTLRGTKFVTDLTMAFAPLHTDADLMVPILDQNEDKYSAVNFDEHGGMHRWENGVRLVNWYMCTTRWNYEWSTLSWKVGTGEKPRNPTCRKVKVERVFVGEEGSALAQVKVRE